MRYSSSARRSAVVRPLRVLHPEGENLLELVYAIGPESSATLAQQAGLTPDQTLTLLARLVRYGLVRAWVTEEGVRYEPNYSSAHDGARP